MIESLEGKLKFSDERWMELTQNEPFVTDYSVPFTFQNKFLVDQL